MGKTKTKIIDDSLPQEEPKKKSEPKKKVDDLVAKINKELGEKEESEGKLALNATNSRREAKHDERIRGEAAGREDVSEQVSESADRSKKNTEPTKKTQPQKVKPRSKKYQEKVASLDKTKSYPLAEAVDMVKKLSYSKFNGTLEAHINTIQTGVRGLVSLPFASGKKLRILAFGKGAQESGANLVGSDEVIEEIGKGKIDFDLVITTSEWMPKLAKVAKNLGPRGLMPNPKNGTIANPSADGLKKAVEGFQAGKTEYRTEPKAPVTHLGLGKLNQPTEELAANIKTLITTIGKTKVKKVALAPTIGPSVKLDLSSI